MSLAEMQESMKIVYGNNVLANPIVIVMALVDLIVKGFALWKAAKLNEKNWFVALLITNSFGIFPAIYLFWKRNIKIS